MASRTVLVALTRHGATHAAHLASALPDADILVTERFAGICTAHSNRAIVYSGPLREQMAGLFTGYKRIVLFLSLGAVVRLIAPHLKSKAHDPAVLAVDDAARFAIPVLAGHLGGANAFAEEVAGILQALPVITTASDVGGTIPVDILGRELGWRVEADKETLTRTAACVINGEPVALIQEAGTRDWWTRSTPLPDNIHCFHEMAAVDPDQFQALLWVTRREVPLALAKQLQGKLVIYRPPERSSHY
uniref:Cobalt-precorrin 5A hydrolase n=1 Tax=Candidatus Kentrum sp. SD TaxID=2126332 RepID=A0A450YSC5_9GAMM|nr:MAG: cobalt-precorrin 5A hydrolase [Candidatus Kentron sp. SD]VFK79827.1 MAG: cobalt-precorrin 5A hydrolase [Candidatus Kentron sp. SD]